MRTQFHSPPVQDRDKSTMKSYIRVDDRAQDANRDGAVPVKSD
jgi:hypothetical protein